MTVTGTIPRHGAEIVRMTVVPALTAAERVSWAIAREWPIVGAVLALAVLCVWGPRLGGAELDPFLVAGYAGGLLLTRGLARSIRRSLVRLEVVVRR
jgi:hypothetical protein